MAFDIKKWLKDDLQMSDDDVALVETKLASKAAIIESGYLAQGDYSRKMNELGTAQTALTAKNAQLDAEALEWANMTAAEKKANGDLKASIDKLEQEKLQLTQRVKRVATDAGLDPAKALEGLETEAVVVKPPVVTSTIDESKFVTREMYNGLAATAIRLPSLLMTMAREHKALTGEDLNTDAIVAEIEARANTRGNQKSLDPRQVWEDTHQISAKREAKRVADHNTEIAAAVERGRTEALSEVQLPTGGSVSGRHAPVLVSGRESILKRPQPGSSIAGAVAAFQSGKYRGDGQKKSA